VLVKTYSCNCLAIAFTFHYRDNTDWIADLDCTNIGFKPSNILLIEENNDILNKLKLLLLSKIDGN
jgi:hypothetical protein